MLRISQVPDSDFQKGTPIVPWVPMQLAQVHRAESDARWRRERFSLVEFLERQMRKGIAINPIFSVAGIILEIFRIDWLHAVDLGVAADFLGNLL